MASEAPQLKDIFVSYNRADEEWARELAGRIERETLDGLPDGPKLTAFFAAWDIEFGQNILNRINDGLRQARFFALVMSPEFFSSDWTNLEWTDQVALDPRNATGRILPLFRRDVSVDEKERIAIPAPFTVLNRLDFREGRDSEAAFRELIRILRGLPKQRGAVGPPTISIPKASQTSASAHEYAFASATPELLVANLLTLDGVPDVVWSGDTDAREPTEVIAKAPTKEAFILEDKRLPR
jgi:TIR domain